MRVLVAAAQAPLRAIVEAASNAADGPVFEVVSDLPELIAQAQTTDCELVLVDFELPDLGGLKGLPLVRAAVGSRPIGVFIAGASLELARRVVGLGAQALLPRVLTAEGLLAVVSLMADGQTLCIAEHTAPLDAHQRASQLSERELQVLTGICEGLQNKEIAHTFEVQEVTVKMHVRAIIRKLGARNRTHAAMIARDLGIC